MPYAFPVHYERDADSPELWNVRLPGLASDGGDAFTCGDNIEDARRMASGLVDALLVTHMRQGGTIPQSGELPKGPGWELAHPSLRVSSALLLRQLRAKSGLSQAETARLLGVKQPVYAVLEDPQRSNPTLATLDRISKAFGVALEISPASEASPKPLRLVQNSGLLVAEPRAGTEYRVRGSRTHNTKPETTRDVRERARKGEGANERSPNLPEGVKIVSRSGKTTAPKTSGKKLPKK